jgi:cold-inducible RNA-binding protein
MNPKKLFVGNLPFKLKTQELQQMFEEFGSVQDAVIITDRESGRSKGFGFVTFEDDGSAKDALSLDGKELEGRPIRVNVAKERENSDRGGRGDRGGRSNDRGGRGDRFGGYRDDRD